MRKTTLRSVPLGLPLVAAACVTLALLAASCLPQPVAEGGDITITVYGFSIMKESLEKAIYPAFVTQLETTARPGSAVSVFFRRFRNRDQPNSARRARRHCNPLDRARRRPTKKDGFVTSDWHSYPAKGIVNKTPFIIVVRKGNPKNIQRLSGSRDAGRALDSPRSDQLGRRAVVHTRYLRFGA